jgi:trans-aconitate 2-methyltransferase
MTKKDWNPDLYLKFGKERIQPSIDLVSRIHFKEPRSIIDIGCGPGNSTQVLFEKWPGSKIIGVDNSPAMIEKAKEEYPTIEWRIFDAGKDTMKEKFDIVFSNATIQWIPDHEGLLVKLSRLLNENGLLAVQLPLFWDMPLGRSIAHIAGQKRWTEATDSVKDLFTINNYSFYYDHLSELFESIEIWQTDYMHVMKSHYSILEMIRSTGLRPYIEQLENETDRKDFEELVLKSIESEYPSQHDGKVLFPFKRLFFIAGK